MAGSTVTKYIDLDDDMTEDEIDEAAWEAAIEMIEFNYEVIDE